VSFFKTLNLAELYNHGEKSESLTVWDKSRGDRWKEMPEEQIVSHGIPFHLSKRDSSASFISLGRLGMY
jgi:hypothetical protein